MQKTIDLYLLSQYFKDECTLEEKSMVEHWTDESINNKEMMAQARQIWKNDQQIKRLNTWLPFIIERLKKLN